MFSRTRSYRQRKHEAGREKNRRQAEVAQLRAKIARLENALAQVIASSDDALINLRSHQDGLSLLATKPVEGFAAAWTSSDSTSQDLGGDDFFLTGHIDQRARRWLLTAK